VLVGYSWGGQAALLVAQALKPRIRVDLLFTVDPVSYFYKSDINISRRDMLVDRWYNYYQNVDKKTLFAGFGLLSSIHGQAFKDADNSVNDQLVTADEIKAAYVSNPDVRKDVSGAYKIDYAHIFITGAKRVVNSWTAALKRVVASGNRTKYW